MYKQDVLVAVELLELAADHYGNHGCNDYELAINRNTRDFVQRFVAEGDYPDEPPFERNGYFIVSDTEVMRYCARKLREWAEQGAPI